jgi:hypothetical protein
MIVQSGIVREAGCFFCGTDLAVHIGSPASAVAFEGETLGEDEVLQRTEKGGAGGGLQGHLAGGYLEATERRAALTRAYFRCFSRNA